MSSSPAEILAILSIPFALVGWHVVALIAAFVSIALTLVNFYLAGLS